MEQKKAHSSAFRQMVPRASRPSKADRKLFGAVGDLDRLNSIVNEKGGHGRRMTI